jgi:uncharacterized membrane protein
MPVTGLALNMMARSTVPRRARSLIGSAVVSSAAALGVGGWILGKARIEAFSDGVIAVAITLLALDLHVPNPGAPGSLAHHLGAQWPGYVAFAVSFLTIGIIWINHHAMLRRLVAVDHVVLMLNLVLLLTICVLPFSTALMAQYLRAGHGQKLAAAVYGGSFLLMSLAFLAMQRTILVAKVHLLHRDLTADLRKAVLRRNAIGILPYVVATLGAIVTPYIALAICAAVAAFYALPRTTSDVHQLDLADATTAQRDEE